MQLAPMPNACALPGNPPLSTIQHEAHPWQLVPHLHVGQARTIEQVELHDTERGGEGPWPILLLFLDSSAGFPRLGHMCCPSVRQGA